MLFLCKFDGPVPITEDLLGLTGSHLVRRHISDGRVHVLGGVAVSKHMWSNALWGTHALACACDDVSDGSCTVLSTIWAFNKVLFWLVESEVLFKDGN
jgi:hypothetical protein